MYFPNMTHVGTLTLQLSHLLGASRCRVPDWLLDHGTCRGVCRCEGAVERQMRTGRQKAPEGTRAAELERKKLVKTHMLRWMLVMASQVVSIGDGAGVARR
jgi:hypothetical protein